MARTLPRSLTIAIIIALVVFCTLYSFSHSNIATRLEQLSYDYLLSLSRADKILPPQVTLILIDDASLALMDPVVGRWPWPRSLYQNLIDYISSGQPKAIMFDILFSERQLNDQSGQNKVNDNGDALLVQATLQSKHTHHAMQFLPTNDLNEQAEPTRPLTPIITQRHGLKNNISDSLEFIKNSLRNTIRYDSFIAPTDELINSSKQLGIVNAVADTDGIYRRAKLFFNYDKFIFPSLSIAPLLSNTLHRQTIIDHQNAIYEKNTTEYTAINFYADYNPLSMAAIFDSISNLYSGEIEKISITPDTFKDKYVFIGASAIGLHDLKPTALSKLAPGVFLHASILGNIISNDLLTNAPDIATSSLIFITALLAAFGILLVKNVYLQASIPLILCTIYFYSSLLVMQNNLILNITLPVFAVILSGLLVWVFLFATEKKEKNEIRRMFSQYVSAAALSVMVDEFKNYKTLGDGSEELVSVLFADIRNFTGLSEKLQPKDVVSVLNFYFSTMTDVIFKHNGTIDKFIGDAIMATWGAPIRSDRHAKDAVSSAIEMYNALSKVNSWLAANDLGKITFGIGVHSGTAILGSIGSAQKADYTVIGDTVNLSSRLEGISKLYQTSIIISESCYQQLDGTIPCQILDRVQVKGKSQAVNIYTPIFYGDDLAIHSKQQAEAVQQTSQQAFQLYQTKNWSAACKLLESLPVPYQNEVLLKKCRSLLEQTVEEDWSPVRIIANK